MRVAVWLVQLCLVLGGLAQVGWTSSGQVDVSDPSLDDFETPEGYALIVGIARYENLNDAQQLEFAERDAEAIYSALISPEGGSFKAENVRKLVGPQATLEAIRRELEEWLSLAAKPEDRVVVYFAGHGFVSDGSGFLAPYDFNPDAIAETGYPMADLGSVFGAIPARWKVLLTDACHSGAISPTDTAVLNQSLLTVDASVFSMTASRDRESSFENAEWGGGHGIFSYYVVKALQGEADRNRDGLVTADETAEYVRVNVRDATEGRQNPTSDQGSYDPDMLLAYHPARAATTESGTLVVEANMDGVEVFLDSRSIGIVDRERTLRLEGVTAGVHVIRGVKAGYLDDGPREHVVYPGLESTATIRILISERPR